MATDALAPCVAKSSAAVILSVWDWHVLVFHEGEFELPGSSYFWEMIENANISLYFTRNFQYYKVRYLKLEKKIDTYAECFLHK